jgi:AcrR family transcriptional regulator
LAKAEKTRALRADALRNRERLLASALKLFTSSKEEVTLSAVAAEAGVGIGTLYRHFPTRDALVAAIYRNEVERLADAAPALLKEMPADQALETWLTRYAGLIATKRGLKDAVRSVFEPGAEASTFSRERMKETVTLLLDAAVKTGKIRGDLDPGDVLRAVSASTWTFAGSGDWQESVRPILRIIMDGLRYQPR